MMNHEMFAGMGFLWMLIVGAIFIVPRMAYLPTSWLPWSIGSSDCYPYRKYHSSLLYSVRPMEKC